MPVFSRPQRPKKRRSVRWQDSFDKSAASLSSDVRRVDELTHICIWRIEEDGEGCEVVPGTPFRVSKARHAPGGPIICVLFTIDPDNDEFCDLWYVYTTEDPEVEITV